MSGARRRLGTAFRPGRSAGRELAGENGAGERLVVRAHVVELAGLATVAVHLLAQGFAILAHRFLDLVRDELLEQARLHRRRASALPRVHRQDVTSMAVSRRHHGGLPRLWAILYISKEYARGAFGREISSLRTPDVLPVSPA